MKAVIELQIPEAALTLLSGANQTNARDLLGILILALLKYLG